LDDHHSVCLGDEALAQAPIVNPLVLPVREAPVAASLVKRVVDVEPINQSNYIGHTDSITECVLRTIGCWLVSDGGSIWIVDLLQASGLGTSRGEAKQLIQQGGVQVNEGKVDSQDLDVPFDPPVLVRVGKRSFAELV
jgi:tyrosyl-tRNA synthetase